ncbi:MAG TPA: hypothetical protein VK658_19610 [Chryseolinea sp.]|nr:hypothetical protein [Chryseolinea sp.]
MSYSSFARLCTLCLCMCIVLWTCTSRDPHRGPVPDADTPMIPGNVSSLNSPFVTAGDRVYMVGNQDGSFPDIGWHVPGEMGGIWDHPIKLMDGFKAAVRVGEEIHCLDRAAAFENFPFANRHRFTFEKLNLTVERFQFVPDATEGLVVEFKFFNNDSQPRTFEFNMTALFDLRPTWLGERTQMTDGKDVLKFDASARAIVAKDANNPWHAMMGSNIEAVYRVGDIACGATTSGQSYNAATLAYTLTIAPGGTSTIPFFIAGSGTSDGDMRKTFDALKGSTDKLLASKAERFSQITSRAAISVPDSGIEKMYGWLKYNIDWLVRSVPNQGTGLSAGLPDYPWWFGADATYALQGVLATGDHHLARETILLLHKLSTQTNNNGRIIHEASTNGSVYNPGNVNETAQFITLVYNYYAWTGDRALVEEVLPEIKKGLSWLTHEKDPDGDHFPNGSGMMEIPGLEADLEMIDVAAYTQQAVASASRLAYALGDSATAKEYGLLAREMGIQINREWWVSNVNAFGDFRATPREAKPIIEAAIIRSDTLKKHTAVAALKKMLPAINTSSKRLQPFVVYSNWVVNTPMETGVADSAKARAALKTAQSYENVYGAFVTGIDKTDEPDSIVLKSRKKIFSYTGAVMTLPTGVLSVSAARYEMTGLSLRYIKKLERSFSYALPGSMYEVSPDFGMITQAWNIYGVAVPIVQYMFGIQPHAYSRLVEITPSLPDAWTNVSINQVRIGNNELSLTLESSQETLTYKIHQTMKDWTLSIDVRGGVKHVVVDGREIEFETLPQKRLDVTGHEMEVVVWNTARVIH